MFVYGGSTYDQSSIFADTHLPWYKSNLILLWALIAVKFYYNHAWFIYCVVKIILNYGLDSSHNQRDGNKS